MIIGLIAAVLFCMIIGMDHPDALAYWQSQVDRYAGSMSDIDWRETMSETEANRWDGFSDEEMRELLSGEWTRGAGIAGELRQELDRRESERTSYRGPGIYRHVNDEEVEVLGKTPASPARAECEQVILRRLTGDLGDLLTEDLAYFNQPTLGGPRYTWVREKDAPAARRRSEADSEITLVYAGQGWARLRTSDGLEYGLQTGDTLNVPAVVS